MMQINANKPAEVEKFWEFKFDPYTFVDADGDLLTIAWERLDP